MEDLQTGKLLSEGTRLTSIKTEDGDQVVSIRLPIPEGDLPVNVSTSTSKNGQSGQEPMVVIDTSQGQDLCASACQRSVLDRCGDRVRVSGSAPKTAQATAVSCQ